MKKLYFLFLFSSVISFGQTQIGSNINGEAANDFSGSESGKGIAISSDGTIVAIGATRNDGNGTDSGHVRMYKNISGVWTQIGADINGEAAYDYSGHSVSLSSDGTIVAIGAYLNGGNGDDSGHVRVYKNISGVWTQIGADINGEAIYDSSGNSVSLSSDGTIVAIGASDNDGNGSNSGNVRVYQNISNVWTQIGADINGEAAYDLSGYNVSLSSDGNTVAISAPNNDGNGTDSGHVRVYKNISGVWTQIGADINGEVAGDYSGESISLSSDGNIIAIGADNNDGNGFNSGHVRVYQNISNVWTQIGTDINGEAAYDLSGYKVSLSSNGNIVAIGAMENDGNGTSSGQVRIYKNLSNVWTQISADIDGEAAGDVSYSCVLSSDGSVVAIGGFQNDGNGSNSGHVRVFDLTAILASNTFVLDNFSIYPNPTSEILNITLENNLTLEKVNIYNALGQIIKSEKSKTIDVKSLAKGNYFVEVITNQGKATKTIIVE